MKRYKKHFTKFVQGDWLEVEHFSTRKIMKCATELVIKNNIVHWHPRQMYQKEVFEDKNNGRNLKTFLVQVHQVLVNQDLQKIK